MAALERRIDLKPLHSPAGGRANGNGRAIAGVRWGDVSVEGVLEEEDVEGVAVDVAVEDLGDGGDGHDGLCGEGEGCGGGGEGGLFCYEVGFVNCLISYCLLPDENAGLYQEEESLSHVCTLVNVKTTCLVTNNEHIICLRCQVHLRGRRNASTVNANHTVIILDMLYTPLCRMFLCSGYH